MREWRVAGWDEPDLSDAITFARSRFEEWPLYLPNIELVPCGDVVKPALFFRVGRYEYQSWSASVESRAITWSRHSTTSDSPYVVVRLSIMFEDPEGAALGVAAIGQYTTTDVASSAHMHRLKVSQLFDPANAQHREKLGAWSAAPGPIIMFFVEETFDTMNYLTIDGASRPRAAQQLAEADREWHPATPTGPGAFEAACAELADELPAKHWWHYA